MTGVFITSTGTEHGKTHIAAAILETWRKAGRTPLPIKPLMSGYDPANLAASDAGRLLTAAGRAPDEAAVNEICLHRFEPPMAPHIAARQAGRSLDYDDLLAFVNARILNVSGPVLVEGAGGVMSPVCDGKLHVDLINDLAMPSILVTANYLGAISHTLSALEVMERRHMPVVAIVVSQPEADAKQPEGLVEELSNWTNLRLIAAPFSLQSEDVAALGKTLCDLMR